MAKSNVGLIAICFTFPFLGLVVYWIVSSLSETTLSLKDWISIFGSYASLYSLVVFLIQFQSVKKTASITREEISKISSVKEWSSYSEMASSLKNDIRCEYYELAVYKFHHIKQALLSIPNIMLSCDSDLQKSRQYCIKAINEHISSIDSFLLDDQVVMPKDQMMHDVEQVSDLFRKMVNVKTQ